MREAMSVFDELAYGFGFVPTSCDSGELIGCEYLSDRYALRGRGHGTATSSSIRMRRGRYNGFDPISVKEDAGQCE